MKLLYYPGCSMKRDFVSYEKLSLAILREVGFTVEELNKWYCCGAIYGLTTDELVKHLGAYRTLVKAQIQGKGAGVRELLVICPFCYNVLKRVHRFLLEDNESYRRLLKYVDEEEPYRFGVNVVHFIEVVYRELSRVKERVKRNLNGLRLAVYYGCTLVRPREIAVDNAENPTIVEKILESLGMKPVNHPFKTDCCGSYMVTSNRELVYRNTSRILNALPRDINVLVTICPLCHYNIDKTIEESNLSSKRIKRIHISELLAYIMGLDEHLPSERRIVFEETTAKT